MSISYKDLKDKKYLEVTKTFVEELLNIRFLDRTRAHCPFHDDRSDSFRIYVDGEDEIKFRCFGACDGNWDVFDLIMKKKKCSFREAQKHFASFLGLEQVEFYTKRKGKEEKEKVEKDPDEPVLKTKRENLTDKHRKIMEDAARFYCKLLLSRPDRFGKILEYLASRGIDEATIERFTIGFCPALEDGEYKGRALLNSHFHEFMKDLGYFRQYQQTGLFRLLNDETAPGFKYFKRHIIHSRDNPYGVYSDYFYNRIIFPIYDVDGRIEGMIGRRPDNRGIRWLKQTQKETYIESKGWLYGIDKSARGIKEYQTVIIVEGIFDFFAFYNILEDRNRPIVVSSLGTRIDKKTVETLKRLRAKHIIVAFDWDPAGMRGIMKVATEIGHTQISFLGSLKEGEDPADSLKGVMSTVSNFGIRHLQKGMEQKSPSGKPVMAAFPVRRMGKDKVVADEILFKPTQALTGEVIEKAQVDEKPKGYWYRIEDIMILLSYNHGNRAELDKKLAHIKSTLEAPKKQPPSNDIQPEYFRLPTKFIEDEDYLKMGEALILHLRIAIEQQRRKRKIKETDTTIAGWLNTSRKTIFKYKNILKQTGYLNIEKKGITQRLSVRYFVKD